MVAFAVYKIMHLFQAGVCHRYLAVISPGMIAENPGSLDFSPAMMHEFCRTLPM